jgi:hypothetical protein
MSMLWLCSNVGLRVYDVLLPFSFLLMTCPYVERMLSARMAAVGRNMYMRTHGVFIPELCQLNNYKHCLAHNMTLQCNIFSIQ